MTHTRRPWRAALLLLAAMACANPEEPPPHVFDWELPAHFAPPPVPAHNPMSAEKVALGRRLFYDDRLSRNNTFSCATCHLQELGFAEGLTVSVGSTGETHPRNSQGLANVAYLSSLNWADTITTLEDQAHAPIFGTDPVELGFAGREQELLGRLRAHRLYPSWFAAAFPGGDPITMLNVQRALASFQRTLVSGDAPIDRMLKGDTTALSADARAGRRLFESARLACSQCHGGLLQTNAAVRAGSGPAQAFFNTGLYNVGGNGSYPDRNTGLHRFTSRAEDMGRFRVPSLRNVALTAPYMHDGSIRTLDAVLDHYAAGGRTVDSGPLAGVGSDNPFKSVHVRGFALTPPERAELLAFLQSLTDQGFVRDSRFSDPWLAFER